MTLKPNHHPAIRFAGLAMTALSLTLLGCIDGAANSVVAAPSAERITIAVGKGKAETRYPATLFGVNANWVSSGHGVVADGELLRDRSFRNQSQATNAAWFASAEKSVGGKVRFKDKGGAPDGYPGYAQISQKGQAYSCISQAISTRLVAGQRYTLNLQARGESEQPALSVFFAGNDFLPVEALDNLSFIEKDQWQPYSFELEPGKQVEGGMLRVCMVNAGKVSLDEFRLTTADSGPAVAAGAAEQIKQLGIKSLRWPAGTDADFFEWKQSIGPLAARGETPTAFGVYQTPSFGLHEFLNFCEQNNIEPLITVNISRPAAEAAELVAYIVGSADTAMGALRASNGRDKPWRVKYFELGNEPSENYRGPHGRDDTVRGYIESSARTASAMRKQAQALGANIELLGVLEASFTVADWVGSVPMLARWNNAVLDEKHGLRTHADHFKGNFYSFFQHRKSESELFANVMGGGTTIARSEQQLRSQFPAMRPFWLTEYGIMVRKNRPAEIVVDRLKDYLAGLSAADILLACAQSGFGGAYLFNLAEAATWGIIRADADFRVRPSGLAFSLFSGLAGRTVAPVTVTGSGHVKLNAGDGNNPQGLEYPLVSAIAGSAGNSLQLVVLNRSYEEAADINIEAAGFDLSAATITRLEAAKTSDNNEGASDRVKLQQQRGDASSVQVAPHSLVRITAPAL